MLLKRRRQEPILPMFGMGIQCGRKSDVRRPIYSIDKSILKKLGIKQDPMKVVLERVNRLSETELKKQAEILRPFLFDGSEADLIINAKVIIPSLIERYAPL